MTRIQWLSSALFIGALGTATLITPTSTGAAAKSKAPQAPELTGLRWFNTPQNKPLTLASRRGKVTIVEFWTFGCFNCRNNLPAYARWQKKFAEQNVEIIGVHTPESDYERDPKNVEKFLREQNISYPIVTDENGENWRRWHQQYWPTVYLIDKAGRVRFKWEGELRENEAQVTRHIETLVKEKR